MGDINPNTPVTEVSESTTTVGENPLTFDELEQITEAKNGKTSSRQAKESEESEKKSKAPTKETKIEAKPEPKSKEGGDKKEKEPVEAKKRTFKAKSGDSEHELDEDAIFSVRINGKDDPVALKDLMSNYSGKTAWDKKFTELDKLRQEFSKNNEGLSRDKAKIKEMLSEKDPQIRLFKMAQIAGVSGPDFRQAFFQDNLKSLEEYSNMSEDQRKASDLEFENKWLKHQSETASNELKNRQAQEELDRKVSSLLATHSLQKGEFVETYEKIKALVEQGRLEEKTLTPESVIEITVKDKLWDKAAAKISELNLKWDQGTTVNNIKELVDNVFAQGFNENQMLEIIDEMWGSARAKKAVSDKIKEKEAFTNVKKPVISNNNTNEAWSFDNLT